MNYFFIFALPFKICGCKRKGHPCMEKGINMTFNNSIYMIVKIREIALFTRAMPGSSLVVHMVEF